MYADDTTVLISKPNYNELKYLNLVITHIVNWLHVNQLILNRDETNIGKSTTNCGSSHSLSFEHANKLLLRFLNLNFHVYILMIGLIGRAI